MLLESHLVLTSTCCCRWRQLRSVRSTPKSSGRAGFPSDRADEYVLGRALLHQMSAAARKGCALNVVRHGHILLHATAHNSVVEEAWQPAEAAQATGCKRGSREFFHHNTKMWIKTLVRESNKSKMTLHLLQAVLLAKVLRFLIDVQYSRA